MKIGYNKGIRIKGVEQMRPKTLNFDQLVNQNKQELLMDEEKVSQIEIRLEKKQTELVMKKRRGINL